MNVIACGNVEARSVLESWWEFCHAVDDVIDEQQWNADSILNAFALGLGFYSHPFYRRYALVLQMPVLLATNFYADSVVWEKEPVLWKRQWADVLRHAGNELIVAVAIIVGGFDHAQKISRALLASCYVYHADKYGTPK